MTIINADIDDVSNFSSKEGEEGERSSNSSLPGEKHQCLLIL